MKRLSDAEFIENVSSIYREVSNFASVAATLGIPIEAIAKEVPGLFGERFASNIELLNEITLRGLENSGRHDEVEATAKSLDDMQQAAVAAKANRSAPAEVELLNDLEDLFKGIFN